MRSHHQARQLALLPSAVLLRLGSSEASPGRLAEAIALAEPQASNRAHPEHDRAATETPVDERPVARREVPRTGPVLDRERGRDRLELGVVGPRHVAAQVPPPTASASSPA